MMLPPAEMRDPLLAAWGDWLDHDGRGVPAHLVGRSVLVMGLGRTCRVDLTQDYATSAAAAVWTWCDDDGAVRVVSYRVLRHDRLQFDAETLHALDRARGFMGLNGERPLLMGLDGAEA